MRHKQEYTFSQVPTATIPRSVFNRSFQHKTTFDAGFLIPLYVDEVLPGDTFRCKVSIFARLGTPIVPIMDNLYLDCHFFFVPNRLVWANWQKFCGEQLNPGDSISYTIPQTIVTTGVGTDSQKLFNYMGVPLGADGAGGNTISVSALFPRAYQLIYNQWYRDENLINSQSVANNDGPDAYTAYKIYRRGKRHDYFTSCLPWTQKGTAVSVFQGGQAPVKGFGVPAAARATGYSNVDVVNVLESGGGTRTYAASWAFATPAPILEASAETSGASVPTVYADLNAATAVSINSLRQAFQIQKLLERDARGGTRYIEILKSHFGVTSPDARVQRPEYLGGGTYPVVINPISQTSGTGLTGQTTPQGNLAAYGTVAAHGVGFTKSFVEHGMVFGIISVRADYTYWQGLNKMWTRSTRYDFYWPSLAHIGEQAVLQGEIYADGTTNDQIVFGYQERWAEYRYKPSMVTGILQPKATGHIELWHLAQEFTSAPTLGQTFIEENPPMTRILAVSGAPHFILDSFFDIQCARPMPIYSVPGLIDHF